MAFGDEIICKAEFQKLSFTRKPYSQTKRFYASSAVKYDF